MQRRTWRHGLAAVLAVVGLVAAGCGDSTDEGGSGGGTTETTAVMAEGGELVIAAEQEPDCTDWIASCSGSSWGFWMMNVTTLPRAFDVSWDGETAAYVPSATMAGEPTVTEGDQPVITYEISPDAVWSDGTAITSTDFAYTYDQIATGEDIYDKTGYDKIESVDDSDPAKVVVTLSEPYAGWRSLFGGGYGILPAHLLDGKDRAAEMAEGYSFSGGPWKIDKWEKGVEAVLVPNDEWWGDAPKLDKVTFKFVTDTAQQFTVLKSGEALVGYPQPQLDVIAQLEEGIDGYQSAVNDRTGNIEALWLNNAKAPFDSKAVRQAVAYSLDRDAIVKRLFGGIGVEKAAQSLEPALVADLNDNEAFAGYTLDLDKVTELMEGDGWTKGADGIWEKGGQKAAFSIQSTQGNARRELTQQVMQEQLKAAGFDVTIENKPAGDLFGQILPAGDYQAGLYAQVLTAPEPGMCTLFCDKNNPDKNEEQSGQNWQRVSVPEAEADMAAVDTELDPAKRAEAGKRAMRLLAENVVSLPLDPLPNILLWSDQIVGPVQDNPVMGPFFNLHEWGLKA